MREKSDDALTSVSTVSKSRPSIRPRTVSFAIVLSLLKRRQVWLGAVGSWNPPSPSTLSLSNVKLTFGYVDFGLHFVYPFLQLPLINLAIVQSDGSLWGCFSQVAVG